jgi:hypothetical protein
MSFRLIPKIVFPILFCVFLFSCKKVNRNIRGIAANLNQDTAKKLMSLNDVDILDYVYGECLSDKIQIGNHWAFLEFQGADSILMKCEQPICFRNFGDSLCYIQIRGIISDTAEHLLCKQLSMLMKQRKNYWELATPMWSDTIVDPGNFGGVECYGPFSLLRFHNENMYGSGFSSADDSYLCFYKGNLFSRGNYPLTGEITNETFPSHNQGILKVSYNDSLKALEYYFFGVRKGIAKEEKNICLVDTSFNILTVNHHTDPPDTINYISAEKLKQIVFELAKKK